MKPRESNRKLTVLVVVMFSIGIFLQALPTATSDCMLDFTPHPYIPSGECIGNTDKINAWDSFPTTRCCQNGLNTLSEALAQRAGFNESIFLSDEQWKGCDTPFPQQDSLSISSCGFSDLYYNSSRCSVWTLKDFIYKFPKVNEDLKSQCSSLDPFNDKCGSCIKAIRLGLNTVMAKLEKEAKDKDTKKLRGICSFVVVTSVAIQHISDLKWINEYYNCLAGLHTKEPSYIKVKYSLAKALLALLVALMAVMLIVVLIKYVTRKKPPKLADGKAGCTWSGLYKFSKAEVENAMNFSNHKVGLGAGSAGRVFKGVLPSGQVVAIKHIYKGNMSDSFTREVDGLSRIRHPNLVCLFGCCVEGGEQYLVYEYCSNGNLAQHLQRRDNTLTWQRRVKILRDCALALRFLHSYPDGCIVHRDIKLTNILLTENMDPKLSDFGLAKMLGMEQSKVFTDVRGTIGYMDPEYMSNAKLTCASDVYSFGIVVLQLLSGRKVIELDIDARDQLTRKAKDVIMGRRPLTDFVDPHLNGNLSVEDFESILHVAVLCVAKSSKGRPTINVVFEEMEKVWKNTETNIKASENNPPGTPQSRSLEVIEV